MSNPNSIVGNESSNNLYGSGSSDHIQGLGGDDRLYGYEGDDILDGGTGNDTLYGQYGNDVLDGGDSNDYLDGGAGDDTLDGGAGSDVLLGGGGSNVYRFQAGFGNDQITGFYYTQPQDIDVVEFGAGIDPQSVGVARSGNMLVLYAGGSVLTIDSYFLSGATVTNAIDEIRFANGVVWTAQALLAMTTTANEYAQTMYGTSGVDLLDGGGGNDTLYGEAGNDMLVGGTGNDHLDGGLGNDTYRFGPAFGTDFISNYTAYQEIDVVEFAAGIDWQDVTVSRKSGSAILRYQGNQLEISGQFNTSTSSYRDGVDEIRFADGTVWDVATLQQRALLPNDYDQDMYGTSGNDVISGAGGVDRIYADAGNDTLDGGAGNDRLEAGAGNDLLIGGAGDDVLIDTAGNDVFRFASGFGIETLTNEDRLSDGADTDVIEFESGISAADARVVRRGSDLVIDLGVPASDSVVIASFFSSNSSVDFRVDEVRFADGTVWNTAELIRRVGLPSDAAQDLYGTQGNDTIDGGGGDDTLYGLGGNDTLLGGAGKDRLEGGPGNDVLDGGDGDDSLQGSDGDDTLLGGAGRDHLLGNLGTDTLGGGEGVDELYGGAGNDVLSGGAGNDTLVGEAGNDVYRFGAGDGSDTIHNDDNLSDGQDYDAIEIGVGLSPAETSLRRDSYDLLIEFGDHPGDSIRISSFFYASDYTSYKIDEVRFADGTVWTLADLMRLSQLPTDANQEIIGSELGDTLDGGGGYDVLRGYAGNDTLTGGANGDTLYGGDGSDILYADGDVPQQPGGGSNWLYGENGDDILNGGVDNDNLNGGDGSDVLIGGEQSDQVFGGEGDDILAGGTGDDYVSGGRGNDTFRFDRGDGWDNASTGGGSDSTDTVEFGAGVAADEVVLVMEDYGFAVSIMGTDEGMYFSGYQWSAEKIGEMRFADGTVWTQSDIEARLLTSILGQDVRDVITGSEANEFIRGLEGSDDLRGSAGNDLLEGGSGNDRLEGGAGDDSYVFGEAWGRDVVHNFDDHSDGQDTDRLRFTAMDSVDMAVSNNGYDLLLTNRITNDSVTVAGFFVQQASGDGGIDQVTFADGVRWSMDELYLRAQVGTAEAQLLHGRDIADTIDAGAGDDTIFGNGGDDILDGGAGNDRLMGGRGADTYRLSVGWGNDVIDDTQLLEGAQELDAISMGEGILAADISATSSMSDLMLRHVDGSTVTLKDFFSGVGRIQQVTFTDGTVWGVNDLVALQLHGTDWDQYLHGSDGNDVADAGGGFDVVQGYAGDDTLGGGDGDDLLDGGAGQDVLDGGAGNDVFLFGRGSGQDRIVSTDPDGAYWDVVQMGDGIGLNDIALSQRGRDVVLRVVDSGDRVTLVDFLPETEDGWPTAIEEIWFADGNILDAYTLISSLPAPVIGTPADDVLVGAITDDFIQGGDGDDTLDGDAGWDVMQGGLGNDRYRVDATGDEVTELVDEGVDAVEASVSWQLGANVENLWLAGEAAQGHGNALANLIVGNSADNLIEGGDGDDQLYGGDANNHGGNDVLRGGAGDDHVQADRYGAAASTAGTGEVHSVLEGGVGNDTLIAAMHSGMLGLVNTLDGGTGDDLLQGSSGDDVFVFRNGDGQDRIHANGSYASDVLRFGPGIDASQLSAMREGDDLVLALANSTDRIAIDSWYQGVDHRLGSVAFDNGGSLTATELEGLVSAMASFATNVQAGAFAASPSDLPALHVLCHVA